MSAPKAEPTLNAFYRMERGVLLHQAARARAAAKSVGQAGAAGQKHAEDVPDPAGASKIV